MKEDNVEITDKTVEEAIEKGLEALGIQRDNAEVEVVSEPGTGLLGLWGNKQAKVKVTVKRNPDNYLKEMLEAVTKEVDPSSQVEVFKVEDGLWASVKGEGMGALIGRKGQTLNSMQYLFNVIMRRQFSNFAGRVIIDIENYRERRNQALAKLAANTAELSYQNQQEIELEPMSAFERRIIHLTLKEDPRVITFSRGEEAYRRVVVSPAEE